jgi:four helix bundle protein
VLSFKKLDVYRASIDFLRLSVRISSRLPRGDRDAKDQLRRAAMSVSLNIGEGAGRVGPQDSARFFAIARGSAMECSAVMDVCHAFGWIDDELYRAAEDLLERIVAMLTKMIR